jgi:hypothetical protein
MSCNVGLVDKAIPVQTGENTGVGRTDVGYGRGTGYLLGSQVGVLL